MFTRYIPLKRILSCIFFLSIGLVLYALHEILYGNISKEEIERRKEEIARIYNSSLG